MPTPVAYTPQPYVRSGRLGDLMRQRGDRAAQFEMQRGERNAALVGNLGQLAMQGLQAYGKEQQEAPIRAQQAEIEALRLEEARAAGAARKQLTVQDAAFAKLIEASGDQMPDPRAIVGIYGPERGTKIAQGFTAFAELQSKQVADARSTAGRLAMGFKSLSPELQTAFWPQVRQAAIEAGLGDDTNIPAEPRPEYIDAVIKWAGQTEAAPSLHNVSPGTTVIDPRNPTAGAVFTAPPTPPTPREPPNPTEASLAAAAAAGDQNAAKALAIMRGQQRQPTGPQAPIAVMGPDGVPVYVHPSEAIGRRPASNREQGRPVTSGDAGRVAELDTSLDDVGVLKTTVQGITGATGTLANVQASLPNWATEMLGGWGQSAKSKQAVIDRVKQVIGKALEGGVLRKEDEAKYEKILPTISDISSVVDTKLKGLEDAIKLRRQRFLESLDDAGFDTANFPPEYVAKTDGAAKRKITVKAPDGSSHDFDTQAEADAFKKLAGMK